MTESWALPKAASPGLRARYVVVLTLLIVGTGVVVWHVHSLLETQLRDAVRARAITGQRVRAERLVGAASGALEAVEAGDTPETERIAAEIREIIDQWWAVHRALHPDHPGQAPPPVTDPEARHKLREVDPFAIGLMNAARRAARAAVSATPETLRRAVRDVRRNKTRYTDQIKALNAQLAASASARIHNTELMGWVSLGALAMLTGALAAFVLEPAVRAHREALSQLENRADAAQRLISRQREALDAAGIVAMTDRDGTILEANDNFCRISRYDRSELIGSNHRLLNSGTHPRAFFREMYATIGRGKIWRGEICNRAKDNSLYWVDTTIVPILGRNGRPERYLTLRIDITARKRAEQRYQLAVRGSRDGLWDWDLTTDRIYYAPRWKQLLGLAEEMVSDSPDEWLGRIISEDLPQFHVDLTCHIEGATDYLDTEVRMRHTDGSVRWMLCRAVAIRDRNGKAVRLAGSLADINELKRAEEKLRRMVQHDQLTGLPNRELFTDRLRRAIEQATRNPAESFAVLFFDFDRFKVINDSLGHHIGDSLLLSIAERFCRELRPGDTVARFGGDEFVVLLHNTGGSERPERVSQRLLTAFAEPHNLARHRVVSTASIGVTTSAHGYTNPEEVIRDADAAMYQAKAEGKGCYKVFDRSMHARAVQRLRLEHLLRQSPLDEQLRVVYQPIVAVESGQAVGFEALLRWDHPTEGAIRPDRLVSIAEETGLIVPIGEWVLRTVCRQIGRWWSDGRLEAPPVVNVNVSKHQVVQADFMQRLRRVLDETGVDPALLKLEITETAIMNERHDMASIMSQIREMGVGLAMDDFGTGHSSLSCVRRFPLDTLKIDRSFIQNLEHHREFAAVMQAIVTLAHNLRMDVVAEGIENEVQLAQLQAMDCEHAQGFLFARPGPPEEAVKWFSTEENQATSDAAEAA